MVNGCGSDSRSGTSANSNMGTIYACCKPLCERLIYRHNATSPADMCFTGNMKIAYVAPTTEMVCYICYSIARPSCLET
ncbi:hypothetical protein CGMCC3_g4383 [Colletotrichum fructicola]|nr:uncharacterized protein CGMCC3_g4383 [Colletotrichum fructicola]KAE9579621.1 hypothetical protein CGMCC3_g4383 [Colletotrichum fructicola]